MGFERRRRELQLRREQLGTRSTELRLMIAEHSRVLVTPLALADQVRAGVRWLRTHPEWPLGALALVVILRPRRAVRWAGSLWWGWRLWQRGQRALQGLAAQLR